MRCFALAICVVLLAKMGWTVKFNESGIEACEEEFFACALPINASSPYHNNTVYQDCTESFSECMQDHAYVKKHKPEDCYLKDAELTNVLVAVIGSVALFVFSNLVFPQVLKAIVYQLNQWRDLDPAAHRYRAMFGRYFVRANDDDGNGRVSASEFISPGTIFTFAAAALPIYATFEYTRASARCAYAQSLPP